MWLEIALQWAITIMIAHNLIPGYRLGITFLASLRVRER